MTYNDLKDIFERQLKFHQNEIKKHEYDIECLKKDIQKTIEIGLDKEIPNSN